MAMMEEVAMTALYVLGVIVLGFGAALFAVMLLVLICCARGESAEERAAAERRAALVAELRYALAQRRQPAPVPPVVVKLGYFPYSSEGRRASEKLMCAVCLEVFEHGEKCSEVPACQHLFHRDCIEVWMKTRTTCPLCRRQIVAEAGSERFSVADDMV